MAATQSKAVDLKRYEGAAPGPYRMGIGKSMAAAGTIRDANSVPLAAVHASILLTGEELQRHNPVLYATATLMTDAPLLRDEVVRLRRVVELLDGACAEALRVLGLPLDADSRIAVASKLHEALASARGES